MASWYQATIVQESKAGTKARSKARLLLIPQAVGGSGADGEDELLLIMGRKPEESVLAKEGVRPVPPADTSWSPTVGESCELLYLDGWWPVRPKSVKGEKWTVMYEAASQKHVVSRAQLRKVVQWDPDVELWVLSKAEAMAAKLAAVPEMKNKTQAKQICGKAIEIFWDGEDQWFEAEVRSLALVPCNPASRRLQPHAIQAATRCIQAATLCLRRCAASTRPRACTSCSTGRTRTSARSGSWSGGQRSQPSGATPSAARRGGWRPKARPSYDPRPPTWRVEREGRMLDGR